MTTITELGYIGISVADPAAWKRYATQVLGWQLVDEGDADRFYFRMDLWHHRFVVHTEPVNGADDDLAYIGWRVADRRALKAIADKLEAAGVVFRWASKEEADERHVLGLIKLEDPAGNPTEIFYSPRIDIHKPFHPGRPLYGKLVTGSQGMGHVILRQTDQDKALAFYELLGFGGDVEYRLRTPGGTLADITFVHCNERQHSLGWFVVPTPKRLGHFMFHYEQLDDLGQTYDAARRSGLPIAVTLGKHGNDRALSFYMAAPSMGWLIEPGWGGEEASPQDQHFFSDVFGHDLEVPEMVGNMRFRIDA